MGKKSEGFLCGVFNSSIYSANRNEFHASQKEHFIVLNFCTAGVKYSGRNALGRSPPAVHIPERQGRMNG